MSGIMHVVLALIFVILAPAMGCLLAGIDRKVSARMQGRRGPPIIQPWRDFRKLMAKERSAPNRFQDFYVASHLVWTAVAGALLFAGMDLLLAVFTLTLAETFLVLAAYCTGSPFSQVGAQRELYVAMSYEPMILMIAAGFYLASGGSLMVEDIARSGPHIVSMLGLFAGLVVVLAMMLRKPPFDLGMSHHAHQDIVQGMATEFSGRTYAMMEVSHWYGTVMMLGIAALFFLNGTWTGLLAGTIAALLVFLLETWVGNGFARMGWRTAIKAGWIAALVLGLGNLAVLMVIS